MKYNTITPDGTTDLIFEDAYTRRDIEIKLRNTMLRCGFSEIVTPVLEFYDVFDRSSAGLAQESLYKLIDTKGRLLVLRPDSTLPIARVAATRLRESDIPQKLFYAQNIYINNEAHSGKSNQIFQFGIECIGSGSRLADLELLILSMNILSALSPDGFTIELGDVGYFNTLISKLSADDHEKEKIRNLIEQKNFPALSQRLEAFGDNRIAEALRQLPRLFGGEDVFDKARALYSDAETEQVLERLKEVYDRLKGIKINGKLIVDLGIVNRLDYYTGLVFKGYVHGVGEAVLSGGRYDRLLAEFGTDAPAVGLALNIDAIATAQRASGKNLEKPPIDVLIYAEKGCELNAIGKAEQLRAEGQRVEITLIEDLARVKQYLIDNGIKHLNIVAADASRFTVSDN